MMCASCVGPDLQTINSKDDLVKRLQAHAEQMSFLEARIGTLESKVMRWYQILDWNKFQMQGCQAQTQVQRYLEDSPLQEVPLEHNFLPQARHEIDQDLICDIELIECLQDVAVQQEQENMCGIPKQFQAPQDNDLENRLLQLEARICSLEREETTSSAREAEQSKAITNSASKLSDTYDLRRELKEVRALATALVPEAGRWAGCVEEVLEVKDRLSRVERCLPVAVEDDPTVQSSSTTSLQQLMHGNESLEQQLGKIQSQMPTSDQEAPSMGVARERSQEDVVRRKTPAAECRKATLHQLEYKFESSIWDLSLFIGTEILSPATSVVVALSFSVNVLLLIGFIWSCIPMATTEFDEKTRDDFHIWRTTVAHNLDFRNSITGESLAHSICKEKRYAPIAGYQLETVLQLRDYLENLEVLDYGIPKGMWICWLSILVWYLTLTVELRIIGNLCTCFTGLPIAPRTWFDKSPRKPDKVCLVCVSRGRLVILTVIVGIRFVVLLSLGYLGTVYLCFELSTEDMILNAVALELMLNFDEILFKVMVPRVPQHVVKLIMPLEERTSPRWVRLSKHWNRYGLYIALLLMYVVLFLSVQNLLLGPFVNNLRENLNALCGAEDLYNFVVTVDAIGIPWSADTPTSSSAPNNYAYHAMREFLHETSHMSGMTAWASQSVGRNNLGLFMHVHDASVLERMVQDLPEFRHPKDWSMVDPSKLSETDGWKDEFLVLGYIDFGDVPNTVYNQYLKFLLGLTGAVNCSHVPVAECTRQGSDVEAVVMKQLCPSQCGCDAPTTGTVTSPYTERVYDGFLGCATWNTRKKQFVDALSNLPCTDTTVLDVFVSWAIGVGDAKKDDGESLFDYLVDLFRDGGCRLVAITRLGSRESTRVCAATSLPAICPESCGCNRSVPWSRKHVINTAFCPYTCQIARPVCTTVEKHHETDPGTRGPFPGYACVFPFEYKGVSYHSCTSKEWTGLWCAIAVQNGMTYRWGDCPNTTACR